MVAVAALPILVVGAVAAAVITFLQVGPLVSAEAFAFRWDRLDPIAGTRRLASPSRAVDLLKALALLVSVGLVTGWTLRDELRGIFGLAAQAGAASGGINPAPAIATALAIVAKQVFVRVGLALLGIGLLDLLYQRWKFAHDQRMSKDEVKREHKDAEGDAHQKHERKRAHRELLEHQTLEAVRDADALIVNPTHVAVALHYDRDGEGAPEVVAKGVEHLARRMKEAARRAGVPILRDVPLARTLYGLEIGDEIPEALYDAVAAVLHAAWAERAGDEGEAEHTAAGGDVTRGGGRT